MLYSGFHVSNTTVNLIQTANANHIRLAFTTPESRVDRDMVINMELDKTDGSLDMTLSTPWKKAAFTGKLPLVYYYYYYCFYHHYYYYSRNNTE